MCGPSGAEKNLAGNEQAFASTLQNSFSSRFANQSDILNGLNSALSPILEAGVGQQGFTPAELAARNTQAINTTAGNYRNAQQAIGTRMSGRGGGGSSGLVSGVDQQIKANLASQAAGTLSNQENQITAENYATGRNNFFNATAGMNALAGLENPQSFGSLGNQANSTAFGEAKTIQEQNQALAKDIAGGVTSLASNFLLPGLGGALGNLDKTGGSTAGEQFGNFFSGGLNALAGG